MCNEVTAVRWNAQEELGWQSISLSQSHSCSNYCFGFVVSVDKKGRLMLTGECRDRRGRLRENEKGIRLRRKTVMALRQMRLHTLPDAVKASEPLDDVMVLDATTSSFSVRCDGGLFQEKVIPDALFWEIHKLLRAYL